MKKFNTIGIEEEQAVLRVIRSGNLSGYTAGTVLGGPEVRALSKEWEDFFGISCAVPCNSATSGLLAACMAISIGPLDEVIVPVLTMSATAAAPKVLGATIVFADIDEHYCIDPNDVGRLINENTKAVIATNLFGHPAQLHQLRQMCDAKGIYLIEDNAQAIMAKEDGIYTGTIGHIGVFSLNVHKHIQCGEGGICVTRDVELYDKLQAAINHGEMRNKTDVGLNLRMTEITAAIAREQLKKLPVIVARRQEIGRLLNEEFKFYGMTGYGSRLPEPRDGCENVFYVWALKLPDDIYRAYENLVPIMEDLPIHFERYNGNISLLPAFMLSSTEADRARLSDTMRMHRDRLLI